MGRQGKGVPNAEMYGCEIDLKYRTVVLVPRLVSTRIRTSDRRTPQLNGATWTHRLRAQERSLTPGVFFGLWFEVRRSK